MLFVYDRLRLVKKSIDAMGNFSSCAAAGFKVSRRSSSGIRSFSASACSSPSSSSRERWPTAGGAYQYTAAAAEDEAEEQQQQQQQHISMNGGGGSVGGPSLAVQEKLQGGGGGGGGGRGRRAAAMVRVLLVDGSVLQFRQPVKVIRLLLDYPHHFICHLDSRQLRPGHHSTLPSLLPDEELQLGHLYLLLPFHSTPSSACAHAHARAPRTHTPAASPRDRQQLHQQYPHADYCHETNYSHHISRHRETKHGASSEKDRLLASHTSSHQLPRRSASSCSTSSSTTYHYQPLRSPTKREKPGATPQTYSSACSPPPASSVTSRATSSSSYSMMDHHADKLGQLGSHRNTRLCDTPELQRAYRSVMLRRCRSWTPRLQAINEISRR